MSKNRRIGIIPSITKQKEMVYFVFNILCLIPLATGMYENVKYRNLYGQELQNCSHDGMALTGYVSTGQCADENDKSGRHHVCIDIGSTDEGRFCNITEQIPNCAQELPCSDDLKSLCPIQNWCISQWDFLSYIEERGGCEMIEDIVCDAINIDAYEAYKRIMASKVIKKESKVKTQNAIDCLEFRCGYSEAMRSIEESLNFPHVAKNERLTIVSLIISAGLIILAAYRYLRQSKDKMDAIIDIIDF